MSKSPVYAHFSIAEEQRISEANPFGWTPYGQLHGVVERFQAIKAHVAGIVLKNFHGACRSRCVGFRSDGLAVWTNYLSADMMSDAEQQARKYICRGLANSTDLILSTGIPASEAGVEDAADRIRECGVRRVEIDVSGQNMGPVAAAFIAALDARKIEVLGEPLPAAAANVETPAWMHGRAYLSNFARCEGYLRDSGPLPTGSIVSVTGFRTPEDREAAAKTATTWLGAGYPIAFPEHRLAELKIGVPA